jgi:hypothetical protein
MYPQYYHTQFAAGAGNVFVVYLVDLRDQPHLCLTMSSGSEKLIAIDPAYGSSKFAILVQTTVISVAPRNTNPGATRWRWILSP